MNYKRIDKPTPHGGAYAIIYFFNDKDESVEEENATKAISCEYDKDGKKICENWMLKDKTVAPVKLKEQGGD